MTTEDRAREECERLRARVAELERDCARLLEERAQYAERWASMSERYGQMSAMRESALATAQHATEECERLRERAEFAERCEHEAREYRDRAAAVMMRETARAEQAEQALARLRETRANEFAAAFDECERLRAENTAREDVAQHFAEVIGSIADMLAAAHEGVPGERIDESVRRLLAERDRLRKKLSASIERSKALASIVFEEEREPMPPSVPVQIGRDTVLLTEEGRRAIGCRQVDTLAREMRRSEQHLWRAIDDDIKAVKEGRRKPMTDEEMLNAPSYATQSTCCGHGCEGCRGVGR